MKLYDKIKKLRTWSKPQLYYKGLHLFNDNNPQFTPFPMHRNKFFLVKNISISSMVNFTWIINNFITFSQNYRQCRKIFKQIENKRSNIALFWCSANTHKNVKLKNRSHLKQLYSYLFYNPCVIFFVKISI